MAKISISMTDNMEAHVQDRVKSGDYNNVSEYFRDLVRRDLDRQSAEDRLRMMLEEAENSGTSDQSVEDIWAEAQSKHLNHRA